MKSCFSSELMLEMLTDCPKLDAEIDKANEEITLVSEPNKGLKVFSSIEKRWREDQDRAVQLYFSHDI